MHRKMRYFSLYHGLVTILVFVLHLIRRNDRYDLNIIYLPQAYRIVCSIGAVILVFPFIPYLIDGEWNEAYYILIPAAIIVNFVRILQMNWRISILEDKIVYRDILGIERSFLPCDVIIKVVVLQCHVIVAPSRKVFIPNDAINVECLVHSINHSR